MRVGFGPKETTRSPSPTKCKSRDGKDTFGGGGRAEGKLVEHRADCRAEYWADHRADLWEEHLLENPQVSLQCSSHLWEC